MKKKTGIIITLILGSIIFLTLGFFACQPDNPNSKQKPETAIFEKIKHDKHNASLKCDQCHHAKDNQKPESCKNCHKKDSEISLEEALQKIKKGTPCKNCHKK